MVNDVIEVTSIGFLIVVSFIVLFVYGVFQVWLFVKKGFKAGGHRGVLNLIISLSVLTLICVIISAVIYDVTIDDIVIAQVGYILVALWILYLIYLQVRFVVIGRNNVLPLVILSIIAGVCVFGTAGEILDPFFPERITSYDIICLHKTPRFYDTTFARLSILLVFMWGLYFFGKIIHLVNLLIDNASRKYQKPLQQSKSSDTMLSTGTTANVSLKDKYEIIREIGRGGMGIVYEAINRKIASERSIQLIQGTAQGAFT